MTNTLNSPGFSIGVGCPGCGGELELQNDFYVLTCVHCGSVLRVIRPETPPAFLIQGKLDLSEIRFHVDRYLKENDLPLSSSALQIKNLYYPYWRIESLRVALRNRVEKREVWGSSDDSPDYDEIRKQEISLSTYSTTVAAGTHIEGIPIAIGIRTQFLKLKPFADEEIQDRFDTLAVTRTADDTVRNEALKFASIGEIGYDACGTNKTILIEPVCSLIYFPFHIVESYDSAGYCRFLLDGVTGRVLHLNHPARDTAGQTDQQNRMNVASSSRILNESTPLPERPVPDRSEPLDLKFGELAVAFHRCPTCGEDLPARPSHMYICRNCQETILLERTIVPLNEIRNTVTGTNKDTLFPFWSFTLAPTSSRFSRALSGIFRSDRIVVPAFHMANTEGLFRLAQRMSAAAPRLSSSVTEEVTNQFLPVDTGPNRALTLARVIVYRKLLARNEHLDYDDIEIQPDHVNLLFAAFHPESYFYVDSILGAVTFEKSYAPGRQTAPVR